MTLTPADVALVLAALRRSVPPPAERAAVAALADRLARVAGEEML